MKRTLSLILVLIMFLSLCACGENTPTDTDGGTSFNSEQAQSLADFDILGEWIIADDGLAVITFNEDGTCSRDGEVAVKYKVEADIAVLTIYYSTPQSYNIEKVGDHYQITGEHFLLRETEEAAIQEIAAKQEKYEQAFVLLEPYLQYADTPWNAIDKLGYEGLSTAYALLCDLGIYRDTADHVGRFSVAENVLLTDGSYDYGYDSEGRQIWGSGSYIYYDHFDKNGILIQRDFYNISGWVGQEVTYVYNTDGSLQKTISRSKDNTEEYVCEYDEHKNLARVGYLPDLEAYTNKYNEQGQLVECITPKGQITYYAYDELGQLICEEIITIEGYKYTKNYHYENDRLVRMEHTGVATFDDGEKTATEISEYIYDGDRLVRIEKEGIGYDGEISTSTKEYKYGTFYWYNAPQK